MLIEFRVRNYRSLREEQVLSMQASPLEDKTDVRLRNVPGCTTSLLPVAALYGANASGKSNVLAALAYMRNAICESHLNWSAGAGVPRTPFAWGPCRGEPSLFEMTMLVEGVKYEYGFAISDTCILEEWLFAWPHGHQQKWFQREGQTLKFGPNLKGENRTIATQTRDNALFMSTAVQYKHPQLLAICQWISGIQYLNLARSREESLDSTSQADHGTLRKILDEDCLAESDTGDGGSRTLQAALATGLRSLLASADVGIVDVRVNKDSGPPVAQGPMLRVDLKHQSPSTDAWLPLAEESQGTRMLFHMAVPILQAIHSGCVLLIDELEASLHRALAQAIVRQFNDRVTNPKHGQLIFTTHDTNLLGTTNGEQLLRRDQIWLTERDQEGATSLFPLTDFKPRESENLERGYLQGRYGAIPFLGNFSLGGE